MGFYTNIRSDVSIVKQTVDRIFTSSKHTCRCKDFICIHYSEKNECWYHVYRIDDLKMKFVRCYNANDNTNRTIGPSYFTETDEYFIIDMLDMLENSNQVYYQLYINNITRYQNNMQVEIYLTDKNRVCMEFYSSLLPLDNNPYLIQNPKFFFNKVQ